MTVFALILGISVALGSGVPQAPSRIECKAGFNDYFERYFRPKPPLPELPPTCDPQMFSPPQKLYTDVGDKPIPQDIHSILEKIYVPEDPAFDSPEWQNLSAVCFASAMAKSALPNPLAEGIERITYVRCGGNADRVFGSEKTEQSKNVWLPPPCVSGNYVNAVRNAFFEAALCVGVDPNDFFPMLVYESALQLNIRNSSGRGGAWGIGQLLGETIKGIEETNQLAALKSKPACQRFSKIIEDSQKSHDEHKKNKAWQPRICDFVEPENYGLLEQGGIGPSAVYRGNPGKALLYAAVTLQKMQRAARNIARTQSQEDLRTLMFALYNGGPNAAGELWKEYKASGMPTFLSFLQTPDPSHSPKRREMSGYVQSILNRNPCKQAGK